jgi:hypothetical protein
MKAYVAFTAALFAALTILHIVRIFAESSTPGRDPFLFLITVLSAVLCAWAVRLLMVARKSPSEAANH